MLEMMFNFSIARRFMRGWQAMKCGKLLRGRRYLNPLLALQKNGTVI